MHQIGVVGLSYRHAGVEDVARFALPRAEIPGRLPALRTLLKAAEILYVGTCNRVEVVYATDDGSAAGDCRSEVFHILTGREPQDMSWQPGSEIPIAVQSIALKLLGAGSATG